MRTLTLVVTALVLTVLADPKTAFATPRTAVIEVKGMVCSA